MKPSEAILLATYKDNPEFWLKYWKTCCTSQLALLARGYIKGLQPLVVSPQWTNLENKDTGSLVVFGEAARESVLSGVVNDPRFRELLDHAFAAADGVARPGWKKITETLRPAVDESIVSPEARIVLAEIPWTDVYCALSDVLGQELYNRQRAAAAVHEELVLNYAILCYHLKSWRLPPSSLLSVLLLLANGRQELRGNLLAISNRFSQTGAAVPAPVPLTQFGSLEDLPTRLLNASDLIRSAHQESSRIGRGEGFAHRAYSIGAPVDPNTEAELPFRLSDEQMPQARDLAWKQYELSVQLFNAIAGTEFLLRSVCPRLQSPDQEIGKVIDSCGPLLPDVLLSKVRDEFSPDSYNLRNRLMHGSFLDIQNRRTELMMNSRIFEEIGVPFLDLADDPHLLENVAAFAQGVLGETCLAIDQAGLSLCTDWAAHFMLDHADLQFANTIHCDLLEDYQTTLTWHDHIRRFLLDYSPCLSVPLQEGLRSWFAHGERLDGIPGFAMLMLLFEPLVRLVLHASGRSVLQAGMSRKGGAPHYRVQYQMLDERGLLSQENVAFLTGALDQREAAVAGRTLLVARRCRDAYAHGAVTNLDCTTRLLYGHLVVKSIQLLTEVAANQNAP